MFTDSHNHTSQFSGDAHMTSIELMDAALAKGLDAVVITEHLEMDYPHKVEKALIFDVDDYFSAFKEWSEHVPAGLSLYSGVELGYQKHLCARYDSLVSRYPFDSVIMSNHLYAGQDPYFFRECYQNPKPQVFARYLDEMTEMFLSCNDFDIAGHYDYIVRYSPYEDPTMKYKDAPESFENFLQALVSKKKSLEINTRSIQKLLAKGIADIWPDREILMRYQALGGDRITLGSDSHDPSTLGYYFTETAAFLKSCGFSELTTYIGRKEIRTPIV